MKKIALVCLLAAISCSKDDDDEKKVSDPPSHSQILAENLEKWQEIKPEVYSYTVRRGYYDETGQWLTKIVVKNDRVTCRAFRQTGDVERDYVEVGDDVGTNDIGAPPKTMDDLYADCAEIISTNPDPKKFFFSVADGILHGCFIHLNEQEQQDVRQGIDNSILILDFLPGEDKCPLTNLPDTDSL